MAKNFWLGMAAFLYLPSPRRGEIIICCIRSEKPWRNGVSAKSDGRSLGYDGEIGVKISTSKAMQDWNGSASPGHYV